ncbi:hypothetical protein K7I13_14650 [Brucepastera parasyntrophica]|uniref:hypothetical protein n=1 Tax=Brucepastera parasyntrophica TaxID=2880008 RepID=UPI0021099D50|nr:hypothetical protein [Brucepastera parasyntrophica]ULQ59674.1 hypothetical protein K7I13_14650 [Brucepastera parasyntrophica]
MKNRKKLHWFLNFFENSYLKKVSVYIFIFSFAGLIQAEQLFSPEWGYALDMPEGYVLADKRDTTRYLFVHNLVPANLQIAVYPSTQFKKASEALGFAAEQISRETKIADFEWRFRSAAITQIHSEQIAGWGIALELETKGNWLVMLCYANAEKAAGLEDFLVSTLDSVYTDTGSWFEPGPMTAFAWGNEAEKIVLYRDSERNLAVPFNSIDSEANQYIVDREFRILTGYMNSPYVIEAWKRYYRSIYRDAWKRLDRASFILSNNLSAESDRLTAELLAWTQDFTYERDFSGSDFLNLPDAFAEKRGDCDSRSLLLVLLLNQMGVDAILLVSPEYSHALAAVDCPGEGARFTEGEKSYLIADTTAKVGPGLIAEDMADPSKWFAVTFPAFGY